MVGHKTTCFEHFLEHLNKVKILRPFLLLSIAIQILHLAKNNIEQVVKSYKECLPTVYLSGIKWEPGHLDCDKTWQDLQLMLPLSQVNI